jgi:hypothetical protein
MLFKIKNFFLVFMGEKDQNRRSFMITQLESLGKCVQIMDNTFVLTIEADDVVRIKSVVEKVSGSNNYRLIVVRLDSDTRAAWCLNEEKSNYFKSVFTEIND